MKAIVRFFVVLALAFSPVSAHAHGEEEHAEQETPASVAPTASGRAERHMPAMSEHAAASDGLPRHDAGRLGSHGIMGVLKSLHPATVHFPIALFLMAAFTELLVLARPTPEREAGVRIMIYGAAAGALVAVLFGWIHTGLWLGGDATMRIHRWNGMLIALLGLAAAWIASRRAETRTALRLVLFPIAVLLIVQGFLGGELAHGTNHLKL